MFCQNCGKEIDEKAKFCQYCGFAIPNSNNDLSTEKSIENQNKNTVDNKQNYVRIIILLVSVLTFFVAAIYFIFSPIKLNMKFMGAVIEAKINYDIIQQKAMFRVGALGFDKDNVSLTDFIGIRLKVLTNRSEVENLFNSIETNANNDIQIQNKPQETTFMFIDNFKDFMQNDKQKTAEEKFITGVGEAYKYYNLNSIMHEDYNYFISGRKSLYQSLLTKQNEIQKQKI